MVNSCQIIDTPVWMVPVIVIGWCEKSNCVKSIPSSVYDSSYSDSTSSTDILDTVTVVTVHIESSCLILVTISISIKSQARQQVGNSDYSLKTFRWP